MKKLSYSVCGKEWMIYAVDFKGQTKELKEKIVELFLEQNLHKFRMGEKLKTHEEYIKVYGEHPTISPLMLEDIAKVITKISRITGVKFNTYPQIYTEKIPYLLVYHEKGNEDYHGDKIYVLLAPLTEEQTPYKSFSLEKKRKKRVIKK